MVSNVSRVWKLDETFALVFEMVLGHIQHVSSHVSLISPRFRGSRSKLAMKIAMSAHFKEYQGKHKTLRVDMILGDTVSKLETFVKILHHISRLMAWSLFTLAWFTTGIPLWASPPSYFAEKSFPYKWGKFLKKLWCCVGGSVTR